MPLFGLINAWISPPGVCGAGMRGSVGSGVELKLRRREMLPYLTLPQTLSLFSTHMGFLGCCWGLGRGMNAEVKNGESDE